MSVKVRISYEKPQELQKVLELLRPMMKSYKAERAGTGHIRGPMWKLRQEAKSPKYGVDLGKTW